MKMRRFQMFRYQLLPVTGKVQLGLLAGVASSADLRSKKNAFFATALRGLRELRHRGIATTIKPIYDQNDLFIFKFGAQKAIQRHTRDLTAERVEDWPHVIVAFDNRPQQQLLLISVNKKAFSSSYVVMRILQDVLQVRLNESLLTVHMEAIFERTDFWDIVHRYPAKITSVRFELISPNMSNISNVLKIDLAQINRDTNSHQTNIELNSPNSGTLEIAETNEIVNSLVEYASQGGGDISLRIKGLKARVRTSRSVRTLEADDVRFEGTPRDLAHAIRRLIDD